MAATELFSTRFFTDANIQAYWRFNSGDLTDSIGSITMTSGSGSTSIAGGKFGFGRDYNGADGNSETHIPYNADFHPAAMKTIAFWFMLNSLPGGTDFIMDNSNTNSGATNFIRMAVSSAGVINHRLVGPTGTFVPQDSAALSTATWYHIGVTHNDNGSNVILYINGTATGAGAAITEAIGTNSLDLYIGRLQPAHGSTGLEPDMTIDDFVVFNRALTAAEMFELANGPTGGVHPTLLLLNVG